MRRLILTTALVLASAAAQAGDPRSLSLSSDSSATTPARPADTPAVAEVPQPSAVAPAAEAPKAAETPKYVDRPALVQPKDERPRVQQPADAREKPVARKTAPTRKAEKRRHRRYWTERRIIGELHRHGIYW